ncbi:hypothetical protein COT44_00725 [Candidatus Shapirobacteria bacterium CG08_land_8_20_14_0_20_39_18]|uniref:Phosphoglycerate kinase n=1 Tax=Candidatus Shapirobacteria bacterium CG08_land_8_20_14_0_20_39_18 TaxID=1974883 RepID=A0A2M6XE46_9BACT|nr:MAG: hypothetical protein COT44_00725 [Candidatus Shapirobacteria bacterium CG08_land_8_20_14_0_20_39_18]PIY64765.1 MAG: hypothetical protein COY91_04200 [Candidatus Shapirobacteria bacterium CG_4_10_14_0_8_um_filter_39_15]PJE67892.1 MAG: hypothetical protein COU94_04645 [Candidatus Shapirobacteria bacterium CG10_big_fil_rev_8_21_14_0_10_38_8]
MNLPDLRIFKLTGKTVLLRVNYDVPIRRSAPQGKPFVEDDSRIVESLPTINYLLEQKAKVILLSHLGRPEGKIVQEYSLRPCADYLNSKFKSQNAKLQFKMQNFDAFQITDNLILLENLRFYLGEEANDPEFAKKLASLGDFYINDAFAVCHRAHASVVSLPNLLPHAAGFDLLEEVNVLSGILENPKRPVVVILGGAKADKLDAVFGLLKWVDKILIGGRLPVEARREKWEAGSDEKIIIANLDDTGKDITKESTEKFVLEVKSAGTIIWAGPMGQYEEATSQAGTEEIIQAIVESSAFKVAGGGDTESAISKFGYDGKFDFISSGGGAMLEFLANGDLPGLKALRE